MTDPETAAAQTRKRRRWGCWSVSLVCLALPLLLVIAIYAGWRRAYAAEVARLVEVAREKGEPTTAEELLAILPKDEKSERATELWRAAMAAAAIPTENEEVLFGHAAWGVVTGEPVDSTRPPTKDDQGRLTEAGRATVADLTNRYRQAIALAEDAAAFGGTTTGLSIEDGDYNGAPFRREYANLSYLLAVEVERRRDAGDREGVARSIAALMAMALAVRNEPGAWTVRNPPFVVWLAREECRRSIEEGELSEETLASLQASCERVDYPASVRRMLLAHQVLEIDRSDGEPSDLNDSSLTRLCPEETSFRVLADLRTILDAAHDPTLYAQVADDVARRNVDLRIDDTNWLMQEYAVSRYGPIDWRLQMPTIVGYELRKNLAELWTFEAGLACARYREKHGDWPSDLDALVPEYLDAVPVDPYDATPLKYVLDGNAFVVYSVGENRLDDRCRYDANRRQELDIPFRVDSRLGQ